MSVLESQRTESKAEFVNTANQLYTETIGFLTRMSARYARLIAGDIAHLAGQVMDEAEKANSIYPNTPQKAKMRIAHLIESHAALNALDVRLTHAYKVMTQNPEGCFTTAQGRQLEKGEAEKKLDNMSQSLGEKIDKERDLLKGAMKARNLKQKE